MRTRAEIKRKPERVKSHRYQNMKKVKRFGLDFGSSESRSVVSVFNADMIVGIDRFPMRSDEENELIVRKAKDLDLVIVSDPMDEHGNSHIYALL